MSPEQAMSNRAIIDHRTDIYSLGITMYELLATQFAHNGTDKATLIRQIAFEELKPLRQIDRTIPRDLQTIVHKAAAKRPEERYFSAGDLAGDLQAFLNHQTISARPPTLAEQGLKWMHRNQRFVLATSAAMLLAIIGLSIAVVRT